MSESNIRTYHCVICDWSCSSLPSTCVKPTRMIVCSVEKELVASQPRCFFNRKIICKHPTKNKERTMCNNDDHAMNPWILVSLFLQADSYNALVWNHLLPASGYCLNDPATDDAGLPVLRQAGFSHLVQSGKQTECHPAFASKPTWFGKPSNLILQANMMSTCMAILNTYRQTTCLCRHKACSRFRIVDVQDKEDQSLAILVDYHRLSLS